MSLDINPENRNAYQMNIRNCSFCRRPGHNILSCNSRPLLNFETMCINNITSLNNNNNIEINFRDFLLNESLRDTILVKAFAIRYCRASSRNNIDTCIDCIINYFRPIIEYRRNIVIEPISGQSEESLQPLEESLQPLEEESIEMPFGQIVNNSSNSNNAIAWSMIFIEMILSIHESYESSIYKKFDIKMNMCENIDELNEKCECNICYEEHENIRFIHFNCGHKFCKDCVKKSLQNEKRENYCCAFCRKEIESFEFREESIKDEFIELMNE
jgi:hypothetical protein